VVGLIVTAVAVTLTSASPATAHTFLVRTSPEAGGRLRASPDEIILDFTEPLAHGSTIEVWDDRDRTVDLLSTAETDGGRLRASLSPLDEGAYRVAWKVISEDGHATEGEFAFGVGTSVPAGASVSSQTSTTTSWPDAVATVVLLAGLAVSFGGLLSERLIWATGGRQARSLLVTGAVAIGLAGALGSVTLSLDRSGALGRPDRWADALITRADRANVALLVLLAVGLILVQRRRVRMAALIPLAGAVVLVAARGHAADAREWWATPATAAHIIIAATWAGGLTQVAWRARLARRAGDTIEPGASRYANAALVAAITTLLFGVAVAVTQLGRLADLTGTRYGRILVVKLVLVAVALAAAFLARRRGLPAVGVRARRLARYTTIEATAIVGVLAASALLASTAPAAGLGTIELPPVPLAEPNMFTADLAGSHQVLVAAAADRLQIRVLPPGGQPTTKQQSTFTGVDPDGTTFDLEPRPCGPGCFDIAHRWTNGTTQLTVTVTSPDAQGGSTDLAVEWPPGPDATSILDQAVAATRSAGDITVTETITSGPTATLQPGQLATTGEYYKSASPFSAGADSVRELPTDDGLTVIAFVVSGTGTWHQLWIDGQHRIRREILVDPGHRIDRTIDY